MVITFGVRLDGQTLIVDETDSAGFSNLGNKPEFLPGDIADDMHLAEVAPHVDDRSHDPDEGLSLGGPIPHGNRDGVLRTQTTPAEVAIAQGQETGNLDFLKG